MDLLSDSNLDASNSLVRMLAIWPSVGTYSKDTNFFFYQVTNEVMSNIYVFCPRVNNMVLGDVDHIRIVTKHNHDSLIYSIISQHLLDS